MKKIEELFYSLGETQELSEKALAISNSSDELRNLFFKKVIDTPEKKEIFCAYYDKDAELQAQINLDIFKIGFEWGMELRGGL